MAAREKTTRPPPEANKARTILEHTEASVKSFLTACDASRTARRATGGTTTDVEQDYLRAMVVFAAAGLDSLLKRLIRDCIRPLAAIDPVPGARTSGSPTR